MIIAVAGKKGTGKDTIAKYISQKYGLKHRSFASTIKRALEIIFDWSSDVWESAEKERVDGRWGISPRQAAQHLGTEWAQFSLTNSFPAYEITVGRNLWVNRTLVEDSIVISDMRFLHEMYAVQEAGGLVLKVHRFGLDNEDSHPSETEVDLIQGVDIDNNGTYEELFAQVDKIVGPFILEETGGFR